VVGRPFGLSFIVAAVQENFALTAVRTSTGKKLK
jgi:hypothetical protein